MSFFKKHLIKAEKISYTYPVLEDTNSFDGEKKKDTSATERAAKALDDVDLEVETGQFICILGRNGSGKSTLARHLNALLVPDKGTVWVDGTDTRDEERIWNIRTSVGMVFQNPDNQIIASVVEEDIAFGPENMGVPSGKIRQEVNRALSDVGMSDYAKASPNRLSGGQKQRVAIAGILAMHPKCIVLDESTAMLDPRGRSEVMNTVRRLNREEGITVISITHYMDEALYADNVFVMSRGRVLIQGTPEEIFSRPDEIEQAGLKLPQICRLAYELREAGLDIPAGITGADELKEAILRIYNADKA